MAFEVGQRVGDYEVVDVLGFGGMGQVYKVQNIISKRVEAMKVLLPNLEGDAQLAERFMQEIEVQARLDHPNIAALHTAQRVGNQLVMVIEFVEGTTIDALLKNGPLPVERAIDYTIQVLAALTYAHAHGIIHRDIKPANMIVTPEGVVKLMDFGIARMADRRLTQTGLTVGSLYYMSPEQINDPQNVDARADLYAVGVSLYQMVTGTRPFEGESDYSIMSAHVSANPVPPIQIDPRLPEALSDIVLMSISKERDRRFQTAEAFRRALQNVAGSVLATAPLPAVNQATVLPGRAPQPHPPAIVTPPALPPTLPPTPTRGGHRGLYMAVGGVAVLAVLALLAWQGPRFLHSSEAAPAASIPQTETAPAANPPAAAPETAAPQASAPTSITPTPEPAAQPATTTRASQLPRGTGAMPTPNTSAATQQPQAQSAPAPVTPSAPAPVAQQAPSSPAATPPANTQAAAQPAAAPGPNPAELREQRQILMLLGTRARAVNTSLQTMRTEQARRGLNMRGDVTIAQQQMEFHLDEAESALKERDLDGAKKSLAAAERELERLEKLLGR